MGNGKQSRYRTARVEEALKEVGPWQFQGLSEDAWALNRQNDSGD